LATPVLDLRNSHIRENVRAYLPMGEECAIGCVEMGGGGVTSASLKTHMLSLVMMTEVAFITTTTVTARS